MARSIFVLIALVVFVCISREVTAEKRRRDSLVAASPRSKRGSWQGKESGVGLSEKAFSPIDGDDEDFRVVAASVKGEQSFFSKDSTKGLMCILGGAMMHITLGTLYCWGNFMSYAPESLKFYDGKQHPGASPDALIIMPATLASQCLTMPFGAQLAAKYGSRATMMLGAIIVSTGVFLSSYATSLSTFMMLYAVMFGAGIGLSYTSPMIAGWKWLPEKKGLVSGAILTGFGAGGFFFSLLGTKLANPNSLNPVKGVFPDEVYNNFPSMLRTLATLYLVGGFAGALMVSEPAKPVSSGKAPPAPGTGVVESLKTKQFWLMWSMIVCSASAGLNVAAIYKQFAAGSPALTGDSFQALVGGLGALFNGVGRLFWGQISDTIGFKKSFMGLTLLQSLLHAYYPFSGGSKFTFTAATCLCYFFLAGNFALMPPAIQKMFGTKNGALIYGLVYSAFGVASIGGMLLGKSLQANFGFEGVFRVLSAMSVVGALLTSRLQPLASLPSSTV